MDVIRLLLILLFSLALPVNGYAALATVSPYCPMQQDQDMTSMPVAQACCCQHGGSGDPHGKPCKCDPMCKTVNPFQAVAAKSVFFPLQQGQPLLQSTIRVISCDASGVWRPPRLL
ncbi:hypothetical protein TPL01_28760 [Sulfuriferula plumbiphila]|uniref:Uncharacterized protein n=1 Tax=Sulfuriferula plumbiphila TaxID=171865 RepID=A0A512LB76_9PROT|nr:hypothetical protein [Sulfuriferula plumbiphila]BBP04354.1 hypothetical protein SFPGR_17760 [Sulfuriferula plumbiphila]GEP31738.1 hypothetical protein TPL01_28760 [Sulfuriferula plumbiphila]